MENNTNDLQERLYVDEIGKANLLETVRWSKFLAIVGFVSLGLIILIGLFFGTFMTKMMAMQGTSAASPIAGMGAFMGFIYVVIAAIYFYPLYALYKFSTKTKLAVKTSNTQTLNDGLRYLKSMFQYIGILTIIGIIIYAFALLAIFLTVGILTNS